MTPTRVRADLALLLDVGSAWAKAGVIGRVRGRWRLVAHVAQPTAWGATALRRSLVEQLAASVDTRLVHRLDDLIADANRIECHTARRPARLAVVAVSRELSGGAARRAAEAAGWEVVETVTFDDGRTLAGRLGILQAAEVDAWLIAGGFDDSRSPRALEAAALVASARRAGGGPVIWAGSAALAGEVDRLFEPGAISVVGNPRPDARREEPAALRTHLAALLRDAVMPQDENHLSSVAFPRAIGALAGATGLRILGVDLGARSATRALAEPDGTFASRVHARGGLAGTVLVPGAAARVARLAGEAGDEAAVAELLQTLRARPSSLPQTPEELAATQTAARVQLAGMQEDGVPGSVDLLIGAVRTIAAASRPAQAARMLLDGVRPLGVTQLAVDAAALLGPLGSLPDEEIGEGLALLGEDLLVPLGTAVVCRGGVPGRLAMRVAVHRSGWPPRSAIEVRTGQLQVVALPRGQVAEVTIELLGGASLGAVRRSTRVKVDATGGVVGLILDARGVPIALPKRSDDRREVLAGWRDSLAREATAGSERVA
ncbi:glutamate mutase L [soil metagenome]